MEGNRNGAVVRALASHQRDPSSISVLCVTRGLSFLVLCFTPKGFCQVSPIFPSPQTPTYDFISVLCHQLVPQR